MAIRRFRYKKDFKQALLIIQETMPNHLYEDAVVSLKEPGETVFFGYFIKDKLTGFTGYYFNGSKFYLSWTAVLPAYQGKGIAQQLVDKVFAELYDCPIYVETYEHPMFRRAVNFYWKNNFKLCGIQKDYLSDGSTCLYLRRG